METEAAEQIRDEGNSNSININSIADIPQVPIHSICI